ncbi:hypothetical protein PRIPAC_79473, partial [Pristionchus pacificus]|uniref:Uncharacterized protein n=1 Tax=Pristionchus pacificus TaxID=54126 RepID=A0A2A6CMJ9_PRIPA
MYNIFDFEGNAEANGHYVIRNVNASEAVGNDVTVWVIERAKASEFDYEIYDAANLNRASGVPRAIVTVMSAMRFRVMADAGEANSYTTRLVGFDNALDNNPDNCNYAYKTRTIHLSYKMHVCSVNIRELATSGFLSSPGYNGCARLDNNQAYLAKQYQYSESNDFLAGPKLTGAQNDCHITVASTQLVIIAYDRLTPSQSFMLRFTSTGEGNTLPLI